MKQEYENKRKTIGKEINFKPGYTKNNYLFK